MVTPSGSDWGNLEEEEALPTSRHWEHVSCVYKSLIAKKIEKFGIDFMCISQLILKEVSILYFCFNQREPPNSPEWIEFIKYIFMCAVTYKCDNLMSLFIYSWLVKHCCITVPHFWVYTVPMSLPSKHLRYVVVTHKPLWLRCIYTSTDSCALQVCWTCVLYRMWVSHIHFYSMFRCCLRSTSSFFHNSTN